MKKAETFTCKFCGFELIKGLNHRWVAPDRREYPESVAGIVCNEGECLNRAGQLTKHGPDAPEYNNGVDYSDGRARYEGVVAV